MNSNLLKKDSGKQISKGAQTRIAIKIAAKQAIAIDSFAGMKIADIMAAAGKSPGAFYLYFKSKELLLHELLEDFQRQLRTEVNAPPSQGETPISHLTERLRLFWRIYRENWPIATAAFQMSMVDKQFSRAWHNIRQQGIRGFTAVVHTAQKNGGCTGLDPALVASAITSMIEYACYNWTSQIGDFPGRLIDDDTATEVLSHIVTHALYSQKNIDL